MGERYRAADLEVFARDLFRAAGLDQDKAETTGRLLVAADMMGHTTHGLALAGAYLDAARSGAMAVTGEPEVVGQAPAVLTWDGGYLPGLWLTSRAVAAASERARTYGTGTVSIGRSHHIGCLAVFLEAATREGLMLIVTCSDPSVASVAPYGGRKPVYTPTRSPSVSRPMATRS